MASHELISTGKRYKFVPTGMIFEVYDRVNNRTQRKSFPIAVIQRQGYFGISWTKRKKVGEHFGISFIESIERFPDNYKQMEVNYEKNRR